MRWRRGSPDFVRGRDLLQLSSVASYAAAERALIDRAAALARAADGGIRTPEGEDLAHHVVGVADILAGLKLDHESIVAALLLGYPKASTGAQAEQDVLKAEFGDSVAMLVEGVARMSQIHNEAKVLNAAEHAAQAERLRKMLLAMVDDIRIVLIKLAERVQTLRFLANGHGDSRAATAREVLELFAPLANRLGVWQFKWELEDLSLRVLEPEAYRSIARALDERRHDRESYIRKVMSHLAKELSAAEIRSAFDREYGAGGGPIAFIDHRTQHSAAGAVERMVARLTIGKKAYAAVEARAREILAEAESLRADLRRLVDEDAGIRAAQES